MEAYRGEGGIQQLPAAEQEAQQIFISARTGFFTLIALFIHLFSSKRAASHSGNSGANVKRLEQETDARILHLKEDAGRISSGVVLLKRVTVMKN